MHIAIAFGCHERAGLRGTCARTAIHHNRFVLRNIGRTQRKQMQRDMNRTINHALRNFLWCTHVNQICAIGSDCLNGEGIKPSKTIQSKHAYSVLNLKIRIG